MLSGRLDLARTDVMCRRRRWRARTAVETLPKLQQHVIGLYSKRRPATIKKNIKTKLFSTGPLLYPTLMQDLYTESETDHAIIILYNNITVSDADCWSYHSYIHHTYAIVISNLYYRRVYVGLRTLTNWL